MCVFENSLIKFYIKTPLWVTVTNKMGILGPILHIIDEISWFVQINVSCNDGFPLNKRENHC